MDTKTKPEIKIEKFDDCLIDWIKESYIPSPDQTELLYLGTVIRINNNLIALKPYSDQYLDKLLEVVSQAVSYEKDRRKK